MTPLANFLLSRLNAAEYCNSEKNLLSTDGCSTRVRRLVNFGIQTLRSTRHKILKNDMREQPVSCNCVCVRHTFCQLAYRSDTLTFTLTPTS